VGTRYSVLMVCMGNICRSPTAEGVLRHLVREAGLEEAIHIDSAGTLDYHVGSPPDERSCAHARRRGYDLSRLRARQVEALDFERFDLILAMDRRNLEELRDACPPQHQHKLRRLMEFAPAGHFDPSTGSGQAKLRTGHFDKLRTGMGQDIRDPYYGGSEGFEAVLDHVEQACRGLLIHLRDALEREP
jgi:low molecular weight protein-tyrosine phosphatase